MHLPKKALRQRGVCVKHLKRCKTSIVVVQVLHRWDLFSFQQQGGGTDETGTNKDSHQLPVISMGTRSSTYLLHFIIVSCQLHLQWDVANPRTTVPFPNHLFPNHLLVFNFLVSHSFHNLSWERCGFVERRSVTFQPISSSSDYGEGSFM